MRKTISLISIVLGAALLVFAIALPTYVVPKGKVLPLDVVSTTSTEPVEARLLDSGALAKGKPVGDNKNRPECKGDNKEVSCFIWKDVEIQTQKFTTAQEPSDKKQVTLEAGQTVFRTDKSEPDNLLSATIDRVTLDRKTQMPVTDPVSSLNLAPPKGKDAEGYTPPEFVRKGIQYQFPMGADRKSYPYFDAQSLTTNPIDFVDEGEQGGEKIYTFEQTVDPTPLYEAQKKYLESDGSLTAAEEGVLASLKLAFPAKVWGLKDDEIRNPKKGEDKDEESEAGPEVEMERYYTVNRKISIEPETGVIVNGAEEIWMFYAQDEEEAKEIAKPENRERELANPKRTAMYLPAQWDEKSKEGQMVTAKEGLSTIKTMGTTVPIIAGLLGLFLLFIGLWLQRAPRKS